MSYVKPSLESLSAKSDSCFLRQIPRNSALPPHDQQPGVIWRPKRGNPLGFLNCRSQQTWNSLVITSKFLVLILNEGSQFTPPYGTGFDHHRPIVGGLIVEGSVSPPSSHSPRPQNRLKILNNYDSWNGYGWQFDIHMDVLYGWLIFRNFE